jgi:hypothetical protein
MRKAAQQNLLVSQYIQGSLELAQGVRIARRGDPPAVQIAGSIQFAQLFESLPAMVIRGGVFRVGYEDRLKLLNRAVHIAGPDVLHRQAITREGIARIIGQQPL